MNFRNGIRKAQKVGGPFSCPKKAISSVPFGLKDHQTDGTGLDWAQGLVAVVEENIAWTAFAFSSFPDFCPNLKILPKIESKKLIQESLGRTQKKARDSF